METLSIFAKVTGPLIYFRSLNSYKCKLKQTETDRCVGAFDCKTLILAIYSQPLSLHAVCGLIVYSDTSVLTTVVVRCSSSCVLTNSPVPFSCLSVSQAGVGAAAAQPAEAHVAAGQRPVPRVAAPPHEGHAADRERVVIRAAPSGGGDEEEGPGAQTRSRRDPQKLVKGTVSVLISAMFTPVVLLATV